MKLALKQILCAVAALAVFLCGLKIYINLQPMSEESAALSSKIAEYNKITQDSNKLLEDLKNGNYSSSISDEEVYAYMESQYYKLAQKENLTQEEQSEMNALYIVLTKQGIDLTPFESSAATEEIAATTPNYEQIIEDIDKAVSESQAFRSEAEKIFQVLDESFIALVNIADNYYALSQKAQLSDDDKDMLAYYYNYITEYGLDLAGRIDETTKVYQDSREELEELMTAQFKKLYVQTAQALLPGAIEQNVKLQEILAEAEKSLSGTQE